MANKVLNTRIFHKHDKESAWSTSSFIPEAGEIIIYDIDDNYTYQRIKIGDGVTAVSALPFVINKDEIMNYIEEVILGGEW